MPSVGMTLSLGPIAVINLGLLPQQLLLPILIGPVASDLISVILRLQHGRQVYPRPHLLAPKLAISEHQL